MIHSHDLRKVATKIFSPLSTAISSTGSPRSLRTIGIHTIVFFCTIVLVWCISFSTKVGAQEPDEMFSGQGGQNSVIQPVTEGESFSGQGGGGTGGVKSSGTSGATGSWNPGATGSWGESDTTEVGNTSNTEVGNTSNTEVSNSKVTGSRSFINPIACSPAAQAQGRCFVELLTEVINIILIFAVPIIVLYIMYAGYLFVTAAGNSEKVSDARNALLWSIIGGVIVLGAKIIVEIIQGTVEGLK